MPELPEVETTAADLRPELCGLTIVSAHVLWPRTAAEPEAELLQSLAAGQRITAVGRRGKYLVFSLASGESLVCHLRMTGRLRVTTPDSALANGPYVRAWFELSDGRQLVFSDVRKFGRLWLVQDVAALLHKLGLEPLEDEFTVEALAERLARRRGPIKALLLDQTLVAGLGNIYADEALFGAGIHPLRPGSSLRPDEIARLHGAIRRVLSAAVSGRGTTLRDYIPPKGERGNFAEELQVYQRTDQPCFRCGQPIRRLRITQRSTHFCPSCQSEEGQP